MENSEKVFVGEIGQQENKEIELKLNEFQNVFGKPVGLPPPRS